MTKDIEKLSAWYDGEISQEDFDKGLENLGSSSESKKILHEYTKKIIKNFNIFESSCF